MLFRFRAGIALALLLVGTSLAPLAATADAGTASISGTVVDQASGLAIPGAKVELYQGTTVVATTTTDQNGSYRFAGEPPAVYRVRIVADGYGATTSDDLPALAGEALTYGVTIRRATAGSQGLRTIASVRTGGAAALQTTTTIHGDLDAKLLQNENFVRVGDALGSLPGVNLNSTSSSVGDDLFINIRGVGVTETATLLDGHPIGPVGVAPSSFFNGVPTAFDYQDTPAFALRNVQAVFGSGALGLYGSDAIGGVIDLQTIDPTSTPRTLLTQGYGNYGKASTVFEATGTAGRVGYALVHAVQGTYGNFAPGQRAQGGLLGTNLTSANIAANTYSTSANYLLRNDLLKLRYNLTPATALTVTGYSGVSWDDKSGNGDNDFLTKQQQLYNANGTIAGGGSTVTDPNTNNTYSCQVGTPGENGTPTAAGIAVLTDGGPTCYTAQQFANASYGPAGGGPGPWQAIRNQDYHARLTTSAGKHNLTFDVYRDNYAVDYNRNAAGGLDPTGTFFVGGFDSEFLRTTGYLASDDITTDRNDLGFGYFGLRQDIASDVYNTSTFQIDTNPTLSLSESNLFLRDVYEFSPKISAFFNGWIKHTTVTNETKFDPRLSLVFKATSRDVFRLTAGGSTSAPTASLRQATTTLNTTPQNINFNCNGQTTNIGSSGNTNVGSESGSDIELAAGHRFSGDSIVQASLYRENVFGKIFEGQLAPGSAGVTIPTALLDQYYARYTNACPGSPVTSPAALLPFLTISSPFNAASGVFQGFELAGRQRISHSVFFDYTYDIQSAVLNGINDSLLQSNPTLINGSQLLGIPLHKGSLGLDFTTRRGFEARFDTSIIAGNNSYNRPGYSYTNAAISQDVGANLKLNLGVFNVFNQATDTYGRIGLGPFQPQNQFATAQNPFDQGSEAFGLPPTQVQLTATYRL